MSPGTSAPVLPPAARAHGDDSSWFCFRLFALYGAFHVTFPVKLFPGSCKQMLRRPLLCRTCWLAGEPVTMVVTSDPGIHPGSASFSFRLVGEACILHLSHQQVAWAEVER